MHVVVMIRFTGVSSVDPGATATDRTKRASAKFHVLGGLRNGGVGRRPRNRVAPARVGIQL